MRWCFNIWPKDCLFHVSPAPPTDLPLNLSLVLLKGSSCQREFFIAIVACWRVKPWVTVKHLETIVCLDTIVLEEAVFLFYLPYL